MFLYFYIFLSEAILRTTTSACRGVVVPSLYVSKSPIFVSRVSNGHGVESVVALQRFAGDTVDRLAIDAMWVKLPVDEEALLLL
jgi:hypothetical protein